ncbi:MIF domain containing protein [Neofusicoccum parvum]|uniref:L-dopachrome isomerase n=2 Tax=Neofusicoccum parvum TaxID=310453 RepID=R1GM53_BOTPV|nr:putative mif domain-containing protein [Neofusicoccum parvum UCRNP2]GME25072.1 MIF domain containing protein [Neofusicoccum parvum]GME31582.1 MIF domain containing protein [Neofusicoccum parvum]
MSNARTSSSTMSSAADQFPKPVGATLVAPPADRDQFSPAQSSFSFEEVPSMSPHGFTEGECLVDRKNITRAVEWGAPGEKKDPIGGPNRGHKSQRKTQYYEGQFNERDTTGPARERITKDTPIVAELKTNVIIKDEYTLVTDLSYQMSQRFQRPEHSIMVSLDHSACLLLGGSFEPAYMLTITALPSQLQPVTNKRNAAMIQTFLRDILGVAADRGIVKFQAIEEANLATEGRTVLGEIEREERRQADENGGLKRAMTKASRRSSLKPKKSLTLSRKGSTRSGRVITPPIPSPGPFDSVTAIPEYEEVSPVDSKLNGVSTKKSKPSLMKSTPNLLAPPVPEEKALPRMGKRKSFIAIFRR